MARGDGGKGERRPDPARPLRAKAKQVIYLHMVGGPPQMDLYDYKPKMNAMVRQGPARLDPHGPAAHDHDQRPGALPHRAVEVQVRPARQVRHVGSANCCRRRPRWSMTCASSAACTPRPSTTSRPSPYMQTGNQVTGRPCLGAVGVLRPRLAQPEPADLRRPRRQADQSGTGAGHLRPAVVVRLPVRRTRRRLLPHGRRSDPVHQQPARRAAGSAPQDPRRPAARSTR